MRVPIRQLDEEAALPTYQYSCTECGHFFEQFQSFSEDSLTVCPECEGRLRKVFNAVGVVFKGSGFYRTDSRSSPGDASASSGPSGSSKDGDSSTAGSGSGSTAKSSGGSSGTEAPKASASSSAGSAA